MALSPQPVIDQPDEPTELDPDRNLPWYVPSTPKPSVQPTTQPGVPQLQAPTGGGTATAQTAQPMATVGGGTTSVDPLAFAGTNPVPTTAAPLTLAAPVQNVVGGSGNTYVPPAPSSPLTGMTDAQKNEYWAKQGIQVAPSSLGVAPTGVGTNNINTYDPAAVAAAQQKLEAGTDPAVAAALADVSRDKTPDLVPHDVPTNNLDEWWAQHGVGDRYISGGPGTATTVDQALLAARGGDTSGFNESMLADLGKASDASNRPGGAYLPGISDPNSSSGPGLPPISLPGNGPSSGPTSTTTTGRQDLFPQDRPGTGDSGVPGQPSTAVVNTAGGGADTGGGPGASWSDINPNDSLLSKVITPDQKVDRVKTFQDALKSTIGNVIDPSYAASAKQLNRYNFGAGRGVSGEARTSQGDLANERERRIADLTAQGTAAATTGSIDDYYRNLGIDLQQQGFQKNLSDTAFNQSKEGALLEDALTNSAFGRALSQENAGYANSPEQWSAYLAKIFGDQSSAAGNAAAGAFKNAGSSGTPQIPAWLLELLGQGGSSGGGGGTNDGGYEVQPE